MIWAIEMQHHQELLIIRNTVGIQPAPENFGGSRHMVLNCHWDGRIKLEKDMSYWVKTQQDTMIIKSETGWKAAYDFDKLK